MNRQEQTQSLNFILKLNNDDLFYLSMTEIVLEKEGYLEIKGILLEETL